MTSTTSSGVCRASRCVNPMLWEVGHVGWFMEHWCLRWRGADASPAPRCSSTPTAGTTRPVSLTTRAGTLTCRRVRDAADTSTTFSMRLSIGSSTPIDPRRYISSSLRSITKTCTARLLLTRDRPAPIRRRPHCAHQRATARDDVRVAGATFERGAPRGSDGFVFDNEKWGHPATVEPLTVRRSTVTEGEYSAFVDDGGYDRPELWTAAGRAWLADTGATGPRYWRRPDGQWEARHFDRWSPITPDAPMMHVTRHEARSVVPLGAAPTADRKRVGIRRIVGRDRGRRRMGVDCKSVRAVSGFPA